MDEDRITALARKVHDDALRATDASIARIEPQLAKFELIAAAQDAAREALAAWVNYHDDTEHPLLAEARAALNQGPKAIAAALLKISNGGTA